MTTPALCLALVACQAALEGIAVDSLAPGVAHLFANYLRARGDSVVARGPTSLVVRRDGTGAWKIVHDHSS